MANVQTATITIGKKDRAKEVIVKIGEGNRAKIEYYLNNYEDEFRENELLEVGEWMGVGYGIVKESEGNILVNNIMKSFRCKTVKEAKNWIKKQLW